MNMKNRFRLVRRGDRGSTFYAFDTSTRNWESLKTKDAEEAARLVRVKNEACKQPAMNLHLARVYLKHSDPAIATRTWQDVMEEIAKSKQGETKARFERAMDDSAFDQIRSQVTIETRAEDFFRVLNEGTVSTNVFLRRIHNFAIALNWLPCAIIPQNRWPRVRYSEKRAITIEEHEAIVARESNAERRAFYQLLWHIGGSQSDVANLKAEDIDWKERVITFKRQKTGKPVILRFGDGAADVLESLPKEGLLFPKIAPQHEKHRAKDFKLRCGYLKIEGVTLHSYRYAWAERAKAAGMPERFAMENLGHNSKAVHRAYSRKAEVKIPSLEEYENKIVKMPEAKAG